MSKAKKSQNVTFGKKGEFTLALGKEQLNDIFKNKLREIDFGVSDETLGALSEGNRKALAHLSKVAEILNDVFLKQDHPDNIRIRKAFQKSLKKNPDPLIEQSYKLFRIFNGVVGSDMYAKQTTPLALVKGKELTSGRGFYPEDITEAELADYIVAHPEQASAIFGNNTIIVRNGEALEAVPYSVIFRDEMQAAAREMLLAADATDHQGFAGYLRWHAQALVNDSDPEMMYRADRAWVGLEDSPLEFTIGRESYDDQLSSSVAANPRVKAVLDANGIKAKKKDILGVRVGIVNQESFAAIQFYREELETFAKYMPFYDEYAQSETGSDAKMTFADVDLVAFSGRYSAVRSGMPVAQNLPNSDKLATQLNVGNRLVFHRQVRNSGDPSQVGKFKKALIDPSQQEWYDSNSSFLFTIGHELAHSLGPRTTTDGRDRAGYLVGFSEFRIQRGDTKSCTGHELNGRRRECG